MPKINFLAVLTAAFSAFIVGGVWYSVLFKDVWMRVNNFTNEDAMNRNPAKTFGLSFLLSLIMALNLAAFLGDGKATIAWGMLAGGLAGAGWVAAAIAVIALFEGRSLQYVLINGGYWVVAFVMMGAILGAWH